MIKVWFSENVADVAEHGTKNDLYSEPTETTRTAHKLMHVRTVLPTRNANDCCIWQDGTHLGDPEQLHLGPQKVS